VKDTRLKAILALRLQPSKLLAFEGHIKCSPTPAHLSDPPPCVPPRGRILFCACV
jgi:hypothetical protein